MMRPSTAKTKQKDPYFWQKTSGEIEERKEKD
jgi:hypothetical protein